MEWSETKWNGMECNVMVCNGIQSIQINGMEWNCIVLYWESKNAMEWDEMKWNDKLNNLSAKEHRDRVTKEVNKLK
jgi:hypothetical protein